MATLTEEQYAALREMIKLCRECREILKSGSTEDRANPKTNPDSFAAVTKPDPFIEPVASPTPFFEPSECVPILQDFADLTREANLAISTANPDRSIEAAVRPYPLPSFSPIKSPPLTKPPDPPDFNSEVESPCVKESIETGSLIQKTGSIVAKATKTPQQEQLPYEIETVMASESIEELGSIGLTGSRLEATCVSPDHLIEIAKNSELLVEPLEPVTMLQVFVALKQKEYQAKTGLEDVELLFSQANSCSNRSVWEPGGLSSSHVYAGHNRKREAELEIYLCNSESTLDEEFKVASTMRHSIRSYGVWHHRKQVLEKGNQHELRLLDKFQRLYFRNCHAWSCYRFIMEPNYMSEQYDLVDTVGYESETRDWIVNSRFTIQDCFGFDLNSSTALETYSCEYKIQNLLLYYTGIEVQAVTIYREMESKQMGTYLVVFHSLQEHKSTYLAKQVKLGFLRKTVMEEKVMDEMYGWPVVHQNQETRRLFTDWLVCMTVSATVFFDDVHLRLLNSGIISVSDIEKKKLRKIYVDNKKKKNRYLRIVELPWVLDSDKLYLLHIEVKKDALMSMLLKGMRYGFEWLVVFLKRLKVCRLLLECLYAHALQISGYSVHDFPKYNGVFQPSGKEIRFSSVYYDGTVQVISRNSIILQGTRRRVSYGICFISTSYKMPSSNLQAVKESKTARIREHVERDINDHEGREKLQVNPDVFFLAFCKKQVTDGEGTKLKDIETGAKKGKNIFLGDDTVILAFTMETRVAGEFSFFNSGIFKNPRLLYEKENSVFVGFRDAQDLLAFFEHNKVMPYLHKTHNKHRPLVALYYTFQSGLHVFSWAASGIMIHEVSVVGKDGVEREERLKTAKHILWNVRSKHVETTKVTHNLETCPGGYLLEFLRIHEARLDMIMDPYNNSKFTSYLRHLVRSYLVSIMRIADTFNATVFKLTMETFEQLLTSILTYEIFHTPRPPELSFYGVRPWFWYPTGLLRHVCNLGVLSRFRSQIPSLSALRTSLF